MTVPEDTTTALVLAAGDLPLPQLWPQLLSGVSVVVAADAGLAHARVLGVTPDVLVGDLDSVGSSDLAAFPALPRETYPVDKDDLDLELALDAALERGAGKLRVAGAFGGRFDHSLAALLVAARYARAGAELSLFGGAHEARLLVGPTTLNLSLAEATTVSLLSLSEASMVSSSGLAFGLQHTTLPFGRGLGVSNHSTLPEVSVTVHHGTLAMLLEHRAVPSDARAAIWGEQQQRIEAALFAADPDLAALIGRVAYDEVFTRPGLSLRSRELLAVALLTALGSVDELPTHLRGALRLGASERQLREVLIHSAMFVGFPRALAAMRELESFLEQRSATSPTTSPTTSPGEHR